MGVLSLHNVWNVQHFGKATLFSLDLGVNDLTLRYTCCSMSAFDTALMK